MRITKVWYLTMLWTLSNIFCMKISIWLYQLKLCTPLLSYYYWMWFIWVCQKIVIFHLSFSKSTIKIYFQYNSYFLNKIFFCLTNKVQFPNIQFCYWNANTWCCSYIWTHIPVNSKDSRLMLSEERNLIFYPGQILRTHFVIPVCFLKLINLE